MPPRGRVALSAQSAKALGITRETLNNLVNGKAGISAEMAVRLAAAFGGGAEAWLRMQSSYDLAQVRRREAEIVAAVRPVERQETSAAAAPEFAHGCSGGDQVR